MKYLVVLNAYSVVGRVYAQGNNDGFVSDGQGPHPVLDCTELSMDNPWYIFAKRPLSSTHSPRKYCLALALRINPRLSG